MMTSAGGSISMARIAAALLTSGMSSRRVGVGRSTKMVVDPRPADPVSQN